ncbi:MAG: HAD-IB family phosphatase [Planctomycetales bacterium]
MNRPPSTDAPPRTSKRRRADKTNASKPTSEPCCAVFADFDGTITVEETFVQMLRRFAPEPAAELIPEMYALRVTLREGVRRIVESIPSKRFPEMLEFVGQAEIRPGFEELLDLLKERRVPLVVVSGGLTKIIQQVLKPYRRRVAGIHAMDVNRRAKLLRVHSEFESGTELVSKVDVMDRYPAGSRVAIGDSVTDLNMAQSADLTFARDKLAKYLDERDVEYVPWQDFHDVRERLESFLPPPPSSRASKR